MSDAPSTPHYSDQTEININDPAQVRYWMECWNVSEVELRKAVADVGTELSDVLVTLGRGIPAVELSGNSFTIPAAVTGM